MRYYIYEVRGTNDPIDGDKVVFEDKGSAINYATDFPQAEVYMVELESDDFSDSFRKVDEIQIKGPEVDANLADPSIPNSCDADNPDCYDQDGNFICTDCEDDLVDDIDECIAKDESLHEDTTADDEYIARKLKSLPNDRHKVIKTKSFKTQEEAINFAKQQKYDDVLYKQHIIEDGKDKGGLEGTVWIANGVISPDDNIEEGCDDRRGHDPINRRERVNMEEVSVDESLEDDDDIETEAFAEELFSALATKREEKAFPKGELDMVPPHDDVPVVKCKIHPVVTHAEDEKPLVEAAGRSSEFYKALEDNSAAQMYVAREIVYSLVDDAESAQKLSVWGDSLEFDEQVALDSLIADALEGANEHEAMMDYLDDRTLPITLSKKIDNNTKQTMDALITSCKSEQEKLDLLFQAINLLVLDGYLN